MSCGDPNCVICQLVRGMAPSAQLMSFSDVAEEIERALRDLERGILVKEAQLAKGLAAFGLSPDALPLVPLIESKTREDIAFTREHVKKYRTLLAEAISQRVTDTGPKVGA